MQKLSGELKNTPTDVKSLQVCSSVNTQLNKEETLSAVSKVLTDNIPEGVQPECTQELKANYVHVLSVEGIPLMPCKPAKAKKLLRNKRAVVIKRFPFTIQLNFECENQVQEITLGIDSGFENIGFSAITETKEVISGTLNLDGRTSERLTERRLYRRNRRNRLWYRKPRFLNRSKSEGWLSPSIQRRYDTHLNLIDKLKKILPISETIIEVAKFDIQKIMNPEISGTDYQQGPLYGYQNMRSYLMDREHGKCQLCGRDFKGQSIHIHHCRPRSESGSNRPKNLAILHKACHEKLHKDSLTLSKPKNYRPNAFMSIIHKRFKEDIPNVKITYGYITFVNRNKLGLEKTHSADAFVIAKGTTQIRCKEWKIEQKHRHNRVIQLNRKGFKPSIRTTIYKIQPKDLIWVAGKVYSVVGIQNKGRYVKVMDSKKVIPTKAIDSMYNFGSFAWNLQPIDAMIIVL